VNKLELISILREQTDLSKDESVSTVKIFFNKMADVLAHGDPGTMQFLRQGIYRIYRKESEDRGEG